MRSTGLWTEPDEAGCPVCGGNCTGFGHPVRGGLIVAEIRSEDLTARSIEEDVEGMLKEHKEADDAVRKSFAHVGDGDRGVQGPYVDGRESRRRILSGEENPHQGAAPDPRDEDDDARAKSGPSETRNKRGPSETRSK